ncbi:integrase [Pseudomonas juntendi]|uniref:integrase n=1 Tax=Pseudomonas juntendi TaxID=2666183 RepID=UPI001FFDBC93|nr:integrase [Pseudomonas juntendi]MCK2111211.1 integrase [Pseudomonas juntendi]
MADIIVFVPKAEKDARHNLAEFIELCRDRLTVFGADLDWYSNAWPNVGNFTIKGAPSRGYTSAQLLNSEIMPFAKAYVRYQQGINRTKLVNELKALRCIEPALLSVKGVADISLVDTTVLDVAGGIAREYEASSYQAGKALEKLVKFLNESKIVPSRLEWRNPISKPKEIDRTDPATKAKRDGKLPDDAHMAAMAEIFANDSLHPRDRFTSSIFALLMSAPSRITEVQKLPLNVLHRQKDKKGVERLGLRFFAGKGYAWDIKYVLPFIEDITEEAVRRLTELSEEGRALARWYETNPTKFYRHDECPDVSEDAPLTDEQACLALGLRADNSRSAIDAYFQNYAPYKQWRQRNEPLTLSFLNEYCHSVLPKGFPWLDVERNLKYSQALCCYRAHEFRLDLTTSRVKLWVPGKSAFTSDLNWIDGQERSIWNRNGYKNPDGSEITMTSHQIRHLLNTAAQRGNVGQLDIARWSGRANIHQNPVYNHMAEDEYVKISENALPEGVLDKVQANAPVTLADLEAIGDAIAHITIYGYCVHDYSMLPCQKHMDCLNCTEHACVKGDAEKLERLKMQRQLTCVQLEKAKAADASGYFGADRWSQHQIKTLERLDQLIEIMENPDVRDGSVIMLNNDQEYSLLKREVSARQDAKQLSEPVPELPLLDFAMDMF